MTILCPGCGSENEAQRRFCNACGVSLEVLCPDRAVSSRLLEELRETSLRLSVRHFPSNAGARSSINTGPRRSRSTTTPPPLAM